jgi:hypothetical protein
VVADRQERPNAEGAEKKEKNTGLKTGHYNGGWRHKVASTKQRAEDRDAESNRKMHIQMLDCFKRERV